MKIASCYNTEVPQPSVPTTNVADKAINEEMDDSLVRAATTASSLKAEQDSGNIDKTRSKATPNEPSSLGTSSGGGSRRQETMGDTIAQTRFENISKTSNDSLLAGVNTPRSDKDRLKLNELMEFCTKLQQRVLDLENTKTAQAQEITSLKLRVNNLGDQEDASKQGRKIDDINKYAEITLVDETQGSVDEATLAQALAALKSAKVQEKANVVKEPSESITKTPTLTTTTAATTITAVSTRPKAKGLVIHEEEQATTPTVSSQQPSQVKSQVKGKGIMVEEPVKMKKKDQISLNEELAFKLQAEEEEEEERLTKEKAQQIKEAKIVAWDNVQVMIDDDYQMAQQMQAEEQGKLIIEEKSKLFVQLIKVRKKHFAAMRAQEMRNKPPTKVQKRNTMSTYLKNMARYKHNQLKNKSFDDIQKLFDKAMKRVNTFVDMDIELMEGSEVRAEGSATRTEGSELQRLIEVVPEKEEIAIDVIPLETKPPSIVDYKIHKEGKKTYYQIIRADGS
ncbi:hypothetical protein Tco_0863801 [Tanacetum coccineum]